MIDPIGELSNPALARNLWLHVDACVGGYFAPFARMNGVPAPPLDFEPAGVRSISADLHEYGKKARQVVATREKLMKAIDALDGLPKEPRAAAIPCRTRAARFRGRALQR